MGDRLCVGSHIAPNPIRHNLLSAMYFHPAPRCYSTGMAKTNRPPSAPEAPKNPRRAASFELRPKALGAVGRPTGGEFAHDQELPAGCKIDDLLATLSDPPEATPETALVSKDPNYDKCGPVAPAPATVPEVVDDLKTLARKAMEWVAGGKALSEFCAQPGAIGMHEMLRMLRTDPELKEEWKIAQSVAADALFHDIIRVADYAVDPNKARIQIEARKFVAGRLRPEVYSEKTKADVEVGITINVRKFGE